MRARPGFLERLEQRVGRRRTELLGAAHDEHLRASLVRRERGPRENEHAHLIDAEVLRLRRASTNRRRVVEASFEHDHVRVERPSLTGSWHRANASAANPARVRRPRRATLAHERLREPERGSLLADAFGPVEEVRVMNAVGRDRAAQRVDRRRLRAHRGEQPGHRGVSARVA